ncbi:MAG: hypothetical protein HYW78_00570 [Parcubacteria group bacterium]|nr:hypothetical protein [Parcubacteria group bacterium]
MNEIKKNSDEKIVFFRADKCLEGEAIGFSIINNRPILFADIDKQEIDLNEVKSIWYWKPLLPRALRTIQPQEHQIFIYRQFLAMWRSISSLLSDRIWVNDYYKSLEAENKPYQLKSASEIGLNIPDTVITSNPKKAKEFWDYCRKEMVIKTLALNPTENSTIYTNKVTEELMLKIERLKSSPVILQKLVPKKHELRITVVGERIFPARIESDSEIDWRRSKIKIQEYNLPKSIEIKCFQLLEALGLRYGCIDMMVTPANQHVFLEINPNGQWEFIEEQTGMPIGQAIAHLLIKREI